MACVEGVGVVGSQDAGASFEVPLEQGDGLVESACGLVGAGEVVAREKCIGMVWAQDTDAVGEILLEQGNGLVKPASCLVGVG